ncbi:ATP-binding cassette sub- D member 1 [Coemansia sp. RSA 986]|nr:ATP-binding cassette sub- D member 1 [Coemansia sp. RSA 986]
MADESSTAETKDGFLGIRVITSGSLPPSKQAAGESDSTMEDSSSSDDQGQCIESSEAITFDNVTIEYGPTFQTPGSRRTKYFTSLTMQIDRGHHCLVVGASAERRRSFKAVLLGSSGSQVTKGTLRSPKPHVGILYIDSRPYVKSGSSLWELLIFPHAKMQSMRRGISERHLLAILRFMDFEYLLEHVGDDWGKVVDWAKVLKKHELLAVSVCRMIYHAPAFALVDDALALLGSTQVRQLFAAAKYHHVTLLVMAEYDPFDAAAARVSRRWSSVDSLDSNEDSSAFMTCIGEFARALRLNKDGAKQSEMPWSYCLFGYGSAERPAFDVTEERAWLWNSLYASLASEESYVSGLQRRTSTLSQCSTTERHWLMTPDTPTASTIFSSESTVSRRQSRVVSPALTARSSVSDFSTGAASSSLRRKLSSDLAPSRSRITIDGALSGFVSPPLLSANTANNRPMSALGALEKKQPLVSVTPTLSSTLSTSVAGSAISELSADEPIVEEANGVQPEEAKEEAQESAVDNDPTSNDDDEPQVEATLEAPLPETKKADPETEFSQPEKSDTNKPKPLVEKANENANCLVSEPVATQAPVRNPYGRPKRSYARPPRSHFGKTAAEIGQHSTSSGPSFIPPASSSSTDQPNDTTASRPFSRNDKGSPSLRTAAVQQQHSSSRAYARASPKKNASSVGSSRIPRPPVSGSGSSSKSSKSDNSEGIVSTPMSNSIQQQGAETLPSISLLSMSPSSIDELADSLGNL